MQERIGATSSLPDYKVYLNQIYGSRFNKETLTSLCCDFTLDELVDHKQYIVSQEDLEKEAHDAAEAKSKRK